MRLVTALGGAMHLVKIRRIEHIRPKNPMAYKRNTKTGLLFAAIYCSTIRRCPFAWVYIFCWRPVCRLSWENFAGVFMPIAFLY